VRLPAGYNGANAYPMVIGAHGCGDTAKNFATWAMAPAASRATQSYIAVSVGAGRDGQCWTAAQDEAKVLAVLDDVRSCFYAHQKKITMAGYSSGGILAYTTAMRNAKRFAGLLIENSSLQSAFGSGTDAALAAAAWKLNVAITARTGDTSFAIANIRTDRTKLQNARFPVQYRELAGGHDGSSDDWSGYLLPKIGAFVAP
jgi:predicted esterase